MNFSQVSVLPKFSRPLMTRARSCSVGQNPMLSPSVHFGAKEGAKEKVEPGQYQQFAIRQQQAEAYRKSLPLVVQSIFPLKGTKSTQADQAAVERALNTHPFLSPEVLAKLSALEKPYLDLLRLIFPLVQNSHDFRRKDLASLANNTPDPVVKDLLLDLMVNDSDQFNRYELAPAVAQHRDPVKRDAMILKLSEDSYDLVQAKAVEMFGLLSDPAVREALLEKKASDPSFKYKYDIAKAAAFMTDAKKQNAVIRKILLSAQDSNIRRALIPAALKSNSPDLRAMVFESLLLDSSDRDTQHALLNVFPQLDDADLMLEILQTLIPQNLYLESDLNASFGQIPSPALKDQLIEGLFKQPMPENQESYPKEHLRLIWVGLSLLKHHSDPKFRDAMFETHHRSLDENIRYGVVRHFNMHDPARQDAVILRLCRETEGYRRREALQLIPRLSTAEKRDEAIERLCRSRDKELRAQGVLLLPHHSQPGTRDTLLKKYAPKNGETGFSQSEELLADTKNAPNRPDMLYIMATDYAATDALGALKAEGHTELLLKALQTLVISDSKQRRENAAKYLNDVADPAVRADLIFEIGRRDDYYLNSDASRALEALGDPSLIDNTIVRLLADPDKKSKKVSAELIPLISDPKVRDTWIEVTAMDPSPDAERYAAAGRLNLVSDPALRDRLIEALLKVDHPRYQAAQWLHLHSNEAFREAQLDHLKNTQSKFDLKQLLIPATRSRNPEVQKAIFSTLLAKVPNDPHDFDRKAAIEQMHLLTQPETLLSLLKTLEASDAAAVIAKIPDPAFRDGILEALELENKTATSSADQKESWATKVLKDSVGSCSDTSRLLVRLRHLLEGGSTTDYSMEQSLAKMPDPARRDAVIEALAQGLSRNEKQLAGKLLVHHSQPERKQALLKALATDPDPFVVSQTMESAIKIQQETLKAFNEMLPGYHKAVEEGVKAAMAGYNADAKNPFSPVDGMVALAILGALGRDGGQLTKTLLPQYKQLLSFAKSEVNKHLTPNQKPYTADDIENVFQKYRHSLLSALAICGTAPLKFKLTQGLGRFSSFLEGLQPLLFDDALVQQLSGLIQSLALSPYESSQLCDLAAGFASLQQKAPLQTFLDEALTKKHLDLAALGGVYLKAFAQACELDCPVENQSIENWNLAYMSALADAYRKFEPDAKTLLKTVIEATLGNRFAQSLLEPNTDVGKANLATARIFQENKLDMNTWLNHKASRDFEIAASQGDSNFNSLLEELSEELIKLLGSRKNQIAPMLHEDTRKQLFQFLKGQGYSFNADQQLTAANPQQMQNGNLARLSEGVVKLLTDKQVFQQAEQGGNQQLMTLKSHLEQLSEGLKQTKAPELVQTGKFKIKAWDRNPGYDLFQGNYSQCCIAINHGNRAAIVEYLTSHAIQIVEVKDENTGKTIANTFLYWAKTKEGKPYLVADNVEIAAQYRDNTAKAILSNLSDFLKDYAKAVNGGNTTPVLLGVNYNDVPTGKLDKEKFTLQFIGKSPDDDMYLDSMRGGGWSNIAKPHTALFNIL